MPAMVNEELWLRLMKPCSGAVILKSGVTWAVEFNIHDSMGGISFFELSLADVGSDKTVDGPSII